MTFATQDKQKHLLKDSRMRRVSFPQRQRAKGRVQQRTQISSKLLYGPVNAKTWRLQEMGWENRKCFGALQGNKLYITFLYASYNEIHSLSVLRLRRETNCIWRFYTQSYNEIWSLKCRNNSPFSEERKYAPPLRQPYGATLLDDQDSSEFLFLNSFDLITPPSCHSTNQHAHQRRWYCRFVPFR